MWKLGRLTISQKLIGLIATLMTLIVGVLTAYFPSRQIGELNRGLVNRADTYGALLSHQLAPAVAFRDRETAREILSSISVDPDVKSGVLYLSDGRPLHAIGTAPSWVPRSGAAETGRRVFAETDRIVVVSPVVSPEGPRGTVVIELETSRMQQRQRVVTITGIAVGGLALAVGVLAAWLIARSIARRLRTIVDVASAVTAGAIDQKPIADASSDEIGTLARAFNAMLLRVEERTNQLATANEQLKREMDERRKIESELLHAQKLEAVGRLASGVAHEINTPVQFVSDSVHFAKDALTDLIALVGRYRAVNTAVLDGTASATSSEEVAEAEKDADLDYLIENLPTALDRSLEGLGRITTIVRSMKEFAHPDQKEMATVNLNQAILSTLTIARNEYKYVADVETDLGDLPPVNCYAGEVNQVVLNIIVNAAHAIADVIKGSENKGRITIRSYVDGDGVIIGISDTGTGIPEHIRDRVFDPFFTTKEVGKGTGQGLAIARSVIVDKHGGELTVQSQVGKGTTFLIRLPIAGKRWGEAEMAA